MSDTQLTNLYKFYCLFNTDLITKSPDYILEKYHKIIGVELNDRKYDKLLKDSELYKDWSSRWSATYGDEETIPDCLIFFLINIQKIDNYILRFDDLVSLFTYSIGDPNLISKIEYKHVHPLLVDHINKIINAFSAYDHKILRNLRIDSILN